MKRTHRALWGFGMAGMVTGAVLAVIGATGASEVAGLAGSYGFMVIGAAAYLLAGLALRERIGRRTTLAAASKAGRSPSAAISARS